MDRLLILSKSQVGGLGGSQYENILVVCACFKMISAVAG